MVILNLKKDEMQLLFDIMPVDPELEGNEGEKDQEIYDRLYRKISFARFKEKR